MAALTRRLSRQLSSQMVSNLVDIPASRVSRTAGDEEDEDAQTVPLQHPLRRQTTAQMNRQRYDEAQRMVYAMVLQQSLPLMVAMWIVAVAFLVATAYVYVTGFIIYSTQGDKPCDQPLRGWVLAMLLVPPVRSVVSLMRAFFKWRGVESRARELGLAMIGFSLVGYPILLALGFSWFLACRTCQETNPRLYNFVAVFFIYHVMQWLSVIFIGFGLMRILRWLLASGALNVLEPQRAAKPGTLLRLETVAYNPDLFSESDEDKQPPECSICWTTFDSRQPIKRTPCRHYFHEHCLGTWLERFAKSCPLCRTNLEEAVEKADDPQEWG